MKEFLSELAEYLAIPSVSAKPEHAEDCLRAAGWVGGRLGEMGFATRLVDTGGHPLVMGQRRVAGRVPHLVVYGHYDVQPAEPLELWKTPAFELVVKGQKAYGRGVADNKGPTLALLAGLSDALAKNPDLPLNITCLIEGEEEVGSANLHKTLSALKKELGHIDAVLLSDTSSGSHKDLWITTGLRGVMAFDISLQGLARDLHSGNGGPIPNAVRELTRVLGGLYDAQGWVRIPGFYKGITRGAKAEMAALKRIFTPAEFAHEIGAKGYYRMDGMSPFEVNRFFPSLELNGIYGGYQGEGSKTIIPARATAKMTCRIAPGQDPDALRRAILAEIEKRVDKRLFDLSIKIHEKGTAAYATSLPHLSARVKADTSVFAAAFGAVHSAVKEATGNPPQYLREGASIPVLSNIKRILGADAIMLGLFREDSLLHSPNENVDLRLLKIGREVWADFFGRMGAVRGR
jgi:acetylornithine deacetylase/succinyl-diaminopimelate desuccinylase-like protein